MTPPRAYMRMYLSLGIGPCQERWQVGTLKFRCRCRFDRNHPHVCQCVCGIPSMTVKLALVVKVGTPVRAHSEVEAMAEKAKRQAGWTDDGPRPAPDSDHEATSRMFAEGVEAGCLFALGYTRDPLPPQPVVLQDEDERFSDADMREEILTTLGSAADQYDVAGILAALMQQFGRVRIDKIPSPDYWAVVIAHDRSDLARDVSALVAKYGIAVTGVNIRTETDPGDPSIVTVEIRGVKQP